MNDIKIFNHEEFGNVRTILIEGEPWLVGKDVAKALNYADTDQAIRKHVDDDDKKLLTRHEIQTRQNGGLETPNNVPNRGLTVINESGLYSLILGSKLKSAKRFKRWVTKEVLPSIRKTGGYNKPQTLLERVQANAELLIAHEERFTKIENKIDDIETNTTLSGAEIQTLNRRIQKRGVELLGGKESTAYKDASTRGKVYASIHKQLKVEFGVSSYMAIRRKDLEIASAIVERYKLPYILEQEIEGKNNQYAFTTTEDFDEYIEKYND